ncbi:hypothetical protein [Nostoc sp.]|uniref:hypothetical protein n=1 Tax=Nostoc sp. TaxID=1180 RepID=UPI002FFA25F6
MSLRAERSEAWQSQSLRLQLLETLREHFVPLREGLRQRNDELSYIYLDPPT